MPLYAVLDCAADDALHGQAARLEPYEARCLFFGKLDPVVKAASPHVVELAPGDPLTELWRTQGWSQNWGTWIESRSDLHKVWRRLRHFTQAKLPSGEGPVLFRFWDPRVLRIYMPLIEPAELSAWFQDIDAYVWPPRTGGAPSATASTARPCRCRPAQRCRLTDPFET